MRIIIVLTFVLFVAVFTVAAMPSYETKDNYYTVPSGNVSSSNTDNSYSTRTYSYSSVTPPAGFIKVRFKSYDSDQKKYIENVAVVNPDSIAMIIPTEDGKVILYLSYGVGKGLNSAPTEVSSITISESYDELVKMINEARGVSSK